MKNWSFSEMEKEYLKQLMEDDIRYKEFLLDLNGDGNGILEQMNKKNGRNIYFRGYNTELKKWVYGHYLRYHGASFILYEDFVIEVDSKSVGQYVADYKGEPIFEGDKVLVESVEDRYMHDVGIVEYDKLDCRFIVNLRKEFGLKQHPVTGEKQRGYEGMGASYDFYYKYKVIGNEYEDNNPVEYNNTIRK